ENVSIAENLLRAIVTGCVERARSSLSVYLNDEEIEALALAVQPESFEAITLREALRLLKEDTGDPRYDEFTLKHFGAWEEVRLTEIVGKNVWLTQFPLLQIPFYHGRMRIDDSGIPIAENADLIL